MNFPWRNIGILMCYVLFVAILLVIFHKENILWIGFGWLIALGFSDKLLNNNDKIMQTSEKVWVPVSVKDKLPDLTEEKDTKSKVVVVIIDEIVPEGGEYYGDKRQDLVVPTLNLAFYTRHLGWCWSFGDQIVPSVVERLTHWLEETENSCGCK